MIVGIYARVSSDDQAERGTIETQLEFARKYCDLHKFDVVEWYKDDGITGTLPLEKRPEGSRLLQDAHDKRFDTLLVYKLDRLGRTARIILNAVYELEQYGVKVKSMTEPFDTGDPSGRFLLTILAGVADLDRSNILDRLWHGANRAARENGRWLGGIVPYGYTVNEERLLVISEDPVAGTNMSEADVIRLIYRLTTEQQMSTIKVADYLNALGIPPAYTKDGRLLTRGKRKEATAGIWRPGRIRQILVNPTYRGLHTYGKRSTKKRELITREVPAIVTEDVWEKAQQVLQDNKIDALRNAKRQYLLRGLVKCGVCGLSYVGTAYNGPGGQLKAYYVCNGKNAYRGPLQGKCTSKNVPQDWLEHMVWSDVVSFIENPGDALDELSAAMDTRKSKRAELEGEWSMVLKSSQDKDTEKQSILDLFRRRIITATDVESQLRKITIEKDALDRRAKDLEKLIQDEVSLDHKFTSAEELLTDLRKKLQGELTFGDRRDIVKALVKEIIVQTKTGDDGRLRADISVLYSFSKVDLHTDKRAENNLGIDLERRASLPVRSSSETEIDSPGNRIRRARIGKGMMAIDLARSAGINPNSVSEHESDRVRVALPVLRRYSEILGVPICYLGCFETVPVNTLGQRILKARLYHGLYAVEFSNMIGVDPVTLRDWERDKRRPLKRYLTALQKYLAILE